VFAHTLRIQRPDATKESAGIPHRGHFRYSFSARDEKDAAMPANTTAPTDVDPMAFLQAVEPPRRREDGLALDRMFREVTGFQPVMWGPSIVGYGRYDYTYKSGHGGRFLATGFSPRKANLVLYILPGYADYQDMLRRLGKHKLGKSCLYLNRLADVDMEVLAGVVRAGLKDLNAIWPVQPH
jgi:hypothetical protein